MNTGTVDLDEIWSARGSRCLLAILVLLLSWAARADITVTGTVTVDDVAAPSGTPLRSSPAHQTFGPEIQIALDVGRLEVDLGSVLTAGTLVEIDAGTVIVTGAGSQITLIGDLNRLHMQGTGSEIQILSGGRIDATGGACGREFGCNVFLGNSVGTDATVLVDGHGSLLSTIDTLFVADGNTDFGTLGADIIASVDLSSGGTIASERVVISGGLSGSNIQVGQLTDATVTVSGAHSRWTATRFTVAAGLNAFATVNVTTGGALIGTDSFMAAIDATAVADISVDGVGSIIDVGTDMLLGLSGTATLTASNKGTVTVGRLLAIGLEPTGTGTASFDGIGTRLTAGDVLVGNTGDGSLNVTGGAVVVIDGVGGDARLGIAPKLGSTGDVSIEGAGSTITVIGTRHSSVVVGTVEFDSASSADGAGMGSLTISDSGLLEVLATQAHGESDILVGYGGDGILQIDTGGSLILDGWLGVGGHSGTGTVNVLSGGTLLVHDGEGGDDRGIGIEIGLRRGQDANGVGTMTVSGLGSSVTVLGEEAFIGIGFAHSEDPESGNAFGQLNVTNGASMTIQANDDMGGIIAGVGGGSTAVMNVTGSGSSVSISGTPAAVLIFASDIDKGVGRAQASLLLDDGASIDVFGTLPEADGRSVVAFGMGLGDATGIVSGGS
ncbi:MAG: hypothetical protein VB949_05960, partial [Pseudomonadales bacterium]